MQIAWAFSDSELVNVSDAVLPNPVYTFRSFVAKITRVEIAAEEEDKNNLIAVGGPELAHFSGFLFTALVDVGEITGRLRFDQQRQVWQLRFSGLNHRVDRNFDTLRARPRGFHQYVEPEGECARFHLG